MKTVFYVVSYGGSGSYMLMRYLQSLGYKVYHIHSRRRPEKLSFVGGINSKEQSVYFEWFNDIEIPRDKVENVKVIYLYRNPIYAIYSRFTNPIHLQHIQCQNINTKIEDVVKSNSDLYGISDFFNSYTSTTTPKNYKIYCVKYEDFFDNIEEFNSVLCIPNVPHKYPTERTKPRIFFYKNELGKIYKNLLEKMDDMEFIEIV
jgi:hypothetical protein